MSFSDYLEQEVLDHVFVGSAYTAPTTLYVSLYTTDSSDSAEGTEVSGGAYARQTVTFTRSGSTVSNSSDIEFPTATANYGTVIAVGVMDALTGGNQLAYAGLTSDKTIETGDVFRIPSGDLDISLD